MKDPIKLTIEDITKLIDQCEAMGVACHIEFVPIKKEKGSEVTNNA